MTGRPSAVNRQIVGQPSAADAVTPQAAPVIVLAHPYSGAAALMSLLSDSGRLTCTSGTGVLPLCHQAARVWRSAEGSDPEYGPVSALAAASIRTMVGAVLTQILARAGWGRWCEFAVASEDAAGTFLSLLPAARFVCLHRCFSDVARAALQASPWGLAGPGYAPFLATHPGSMFAALAAWWVARTAALLAFEQDHPDECLRIRYEDLAEDRPGTAATLVSFLGISDTGSQAEMSPEHLPAAGTAAEPAGPALESRLPLTQLPPALLAEVNDLLNRLGYPLLTGPAPQADP